jgi:hypothetical protein
MTHRVQDLLHVFRAGVDHGSEHRDCQRYDMEGSTNWKLIYLLEPFNPSSPTMVNLVLGDWHTMEGIHPRLRGLTAEIEGELEDLDPP